GGGGGGEYYVPLALSREWKGALQLTLKDSAVAQSKSFTLRRRLKFAPVVASTVARQFIDRLTHSYQKVFVSPEEVKYDFHRDQGFLHFQMGNYVKARDALFLYIDHVEDRDPGVLYMLAMCYKNMDDHKEETEFLKRAERVARTDPEIINALGESLYNIEEYAEAITFLEKARKLSPGNSGIYYRLGVCNEKLNNSVEAEKFYKKAIALDPQQVVYHQTLGFLYKAGDRHKESIACLRSALHAEWRQKRR
ncbi:MAG: tetratricopeptide repeat protein, partial [Candidatus Omnitrophica bacterium]|nr:tetratricopeptide repeat protein [Candidatus Omnitrophota bacterium]